MGVKNKDTTSENSSTRTVEIEQELWNRYTAGGTQDINERMWEIWEDEKENEDIKELKQKVGELEPISEEEARKCKEIGEINGNRAMLAYIKGSNVDGLNEDELKVVISQLYGQTSTYSILQFVKNYAVEVDGDYYLNPDKAKEAVKEKQEEAFEEIRTKKEKKEKVGKKYGRAPARKARDYKHKIEELEEDISELREELGDYNQKEDRIDEGEALGVEGWG